MSKNNKLINDLNKIASRNREAHMMAAVQKDTPQIYSALAIALYRLLEIPEEEKAEAISVVFAESQKVWTECVDKGLDILELCQKETGIELRNKEE